MHYNIFEGSINESSRSPRKSVHTLMFDDLTGESPEDRLKTPFAPYGNDKTQVSYHSVLLRQVCGLTALYRIVFES